MIKKEYTLINVLKFFCAILVIAIHSIYGKTNSEYFLKTTARIAVPIFFIISGYFIYNKVEKREFKRLNKYALHIFKLYIIWSIVYLIFAYDEFFVYDNITKNLLYITKNFLFIGTYYHLWYLISYFVAIYIVYFMYNKLGIKFSLIISLILYLGSLLADSYYGLLPPCKLMAMVDIYIYLFGEMGNSFIWILIFIFLGMAIKKYNLNTKMIHYKMILTIVFCLFITENYILRYIGISRDNNMSIFLLLLAPIIVMYILTLEEKFKISFNKYNKFFKDSSLYIYLVHPLILKYIMLFSTLKKSFNMFVIITILSVLITYIWYLFKESKYKTEVRLD